MQTTNQKYQFNNLSNFSRDNVVEQKLQKCSHIILLVIREFSLEFGPILPEINSIAVECVVYKRSLKKIVKHQSSTS